MASPELSPTEQERLRQLELELKQESPPTRSATEAPTLWERIRSQSQPLLTILTILGCILAVLLVFRFLGGLIRIGILVGLGYLLYRFVVGPRLGLIQPKSKQKAAKTDPDSADF